MYQANQQTIEMSSFGIEGHTIDHSWYHILKKPSKKDPIGKTDSTACVLLADIVYWYKPVHSIDQDSGVHTIGKKFKSDILQRSYAQIEQQFGFTKNQARDSLELLESLGIAERIFRDEMINGQKVPNIMYIKFNHKKLIELMKSYYELQGDLKKRIGSSEISDDPLGNFRPPPRKKPTYTKTSTETSHKSDLIERASAEIKIIDFDGREQTLTKEDLFSLAVQHRTDWTAQEIEILYKRLSNHKGNVRNLIRFCISIIEKERIITKVQNYKQGNQECPSNKEYTHQKKSPNTTDRNETNLEKNKSQNTECEILDKDIGTRLFANWRETLKPFNPYSNG